MDKINIACLRMRQEPRARQRQRRQARKKVVIILLWLSLRLGTDREEAKEVKRMIRLTGSA